MCFCTRSVYLHDGVYHVDAIHVFPEFFNITLPAWRWRVFS